VPIIQNFSLPAGNGQAVTFTVEPIDGEIPSGSTVRWRLFEQQDGVPIVGVAPLIEKDSNSSGDIDILSSPPMTFVLYLYEDETVGLLRNYYHEADIIDPLDSVVTVTCGIMTVTQTEIR
jgi:hypothetical protein